MPSLRPAVVKIIRFCSGFHCFIAQITADVKKAYLSDNMERHAINSTIINYLSPYRPARIGVFGSFARQEEKTDSDIDILVRFRETISLLELVRIHRELSVLLGRRVELVTEQALKNKRIKKYIYDDLQIFFE